MRLAIGQMCSADQHGPNIATMTQFAAEAASAGADLLALPEVAGLMNRNPEQAAHLVDSFETDPYMQAVQAAAARHGLWLHAGSTPVTGPDGKFFNRSALMAPDGSVQAIYDKIHLFDVALDGQKPIGESKRFAPGTRAVVADTAFGPMGLTICYDLRFPQLYRELAQAGAQLIFVPSAFTVPTGRAHWEVLLRARAIECGAFVVAPAQVGHHADGRSTWGHSLVVDPWGQVLVDMGGAATGLELIDIDLAAAARARTQIPSLNHMPQYQLPSPVETD